MSVKRERKMIGLSDLLFVLMFIPGFLRTDSGGSEQQILQKPQETVAQEQVISEATIPEQVPSHESSPVAQIDQESPTPKVVQPVEPVVVSKPFDPTMVDQSYSWGELVKKVVGREVERPRTTGKKIVHYMEKRMGKLATMFDTTKEEMIAYMKMCEEMGKQNIPGLSEQYRIILQKMKDFLIGAIEVVDLEYRGGQALGKRRVGREESNQINARLTQEDEVKAQTAKNYVEKMLLRVAEFEKLALKREATSRDFQALKKEVDDIYQRHSKELLKVIEKTEKDVVRAKVLKEWLGEKEE